MTVEKSCEAIHPFERVEATENLKSFIRSQVLLSDPESKFKFLNLNIYCRNLLPQKVMNHTQVIDDRDTSPAAILTPDQDTDTTLRNRHDLTVNRNSSLSHNSNLPTTNNQTIVSGASNNGRTIVNVPSSELTFSMYYEAVCNEGQCQEACRVLQLVENSSCLNICLIKVRPQDNPEVNQVKIIQTLHIAKLMAEIDMPAGGGDVHSTFSGARFKPVNVKARVLTESEMRQMRQQDIYNFQPYYYSQSYYSNSDSC